MNLMLTEQLRSTVGFPASRTGPGILEHLIVRSLSGENRREMRKAGEDKEMS